MQTILTILRAAHCRSTHHYFALDALPEVVSPEGGRLASMLLAHFPVYLQGAKDPDNLFRDFENHVIHVSDGYWGGAAKTAEKWRLQAHNQLQSKKWKEAAYSIGVLSHYFSDPWMPLHTGQTTRETLFHRPLEWSVCCAYQEIFDRCLANEALESFTLPAGEGWLTETIHAGARLANGYYESIMDDYDLQESGKQPAVALGNRSKDDLAQIFTWVLTAWGGALDRIASECKCQIPAFSLTLPTLLASIQVPIKKIVASVKNAEQRREVEAILREYNQTGQVVKNVPEEQRAVTRMREKNPNLTSKTSAVKRVKAPSAATPSAAPPKRSSLALPNQTEPVVKPSKERLGPWSPIVDAPAIGPKTAERLQAIKLVTIQDLLKSNPAEVAGALRTSWINEQTVATWIVQARLVCEIEGLTAVGSGLLALAGIQTAADIDRCGASKVHEAILSAAQSSQGKRILRDKAPPTLNRVERWCDAARKFLADAKSGILDAA